MEPVGHAQFSENRCQMGFHSLLGDVEFVGDFFVAGTDPKQLNDFALPRRQSFEGLGELRNGFRPLFLRQ
jgi:hypothetical protein